MWGDRQTDEHTDRQKKNIFWSECSPTEQCPVGTMSGQNQSGSKAVSDDNTFGMGMISDVCGDDQRGEPCQGDRMMMNDTSNEVMATNGDDNDDLNVGTVTPSVEVNENTMKQECNVGVDGWCNTHNVKTTTISVSSKIWHKNKKKNVYGWKYIKKKKTICNPGRSAPVAPHISNLSANLGGGLGNLHVAGSEYDKNIPRLKSESEDKANTQRWDQSTDGDV